MKVCASKLWIVLTVLLLTGLAVGLLFFSMFSATRVTWPFVSDYDLLVSDSIKLSQARSSGLVDSSEWPESIQALSPQFVCVQTELVVIVLSTGGIDAGWGFYVYTKPYFDADDLKGAHLHPTEHQRVYRSTHIE